MSFRVKLARNQWLQLTNVYAPPHNTVGHDASKIATDIINVTDDSLIVGDFNAHSPIWDHTHPSDQRGETLEDWLSAEGLATLNSGEPTRVSRIEGQRDSAPDISLCGSTFSKKCVWELMDGIGSSDHIPICIKVAHKVNHQSIRGSEAKWKVKNVDWSKFSEAVEQHMAQVNATEDNQIKQKIALFNGALISNAHAHVGKAKRPKRPKPWMNPKVRALVRKRNKLWRERRTHPDAWRENWLNACGEVAEATKDAKAESWRDLLEDTTRSTDELWKIVKSLDGCPDTNSPNEALLHNGRRITSNKRKANVFMQFYASVSKLQFNKEDRDTNRELKQRLSNPTGPVDHQPKFTMRELRRAISKMKAKGAAGPDDIPPSFLKALGPIALQTLLNIFNASFHLADCPQVWKNAIILPLLKSGKPPGDLKSFRPISLTSCVVKLFERMIADRLMHLAETNGWLNSAQAGFRKGRSCEDQILRMVQAIEDGFQQKRTHRSVLVLLDFSQAFDTVWRQKLLLSMLDLGVPHAYVKWIHQFLSNRQAKVKFNGSLSSSRQLHQGLPQGSVLSPLLFIFYINNLAKILPATTTNCLFADDVSILATHRKKELALEEAQKAVDIVVDWCAKWKLNLNASKSEISFFSNYTHDAKWSPVLMINNAPIKYNPTPVLLGITLDRQLTFTPTPPTSQSEPAARPTSWRPYPIRNGDGRKIP